MPFYNEAAFLAESVGSVASQSEFDFELIAVDDGSTDDGAAVIAAFQDPRIRILKPGKVGKNAALNLAFSASRAPVLTFFCGDDTLPADSLRHKLEALALFDPLTTPAMVYGKARMMSTDPRFDGLVVPRDPDRGSDSASAQGFTRALAEKIFPLPGELPNEDQWSALCARFFAVETVHLPVIVWNYRIHEENSHNRKVNFAAYSRQYHDRFLVYQRFLDRFGPALPEAGRQWLTNRAMLEDARWNRRLSGILRAQAPVKEKIRTLIYAFPLLYRIRMRFYGFFSGR